MMDVLDYIRFREGVAAARREYPVVDEATRIMRNRRRYERAPLNLVENALLDKIDTPFRVSEE